MRRITGWLSQDRWPRPRRSRPFGALARLVWLAFIVFPLVNAITNRGSTSEHLLAIAGTVVFIAVYIWLVLLLFRRDGGGVRLVLTATLVVLAGVLTAADRTGWGFLFTYAAACAALAAPPPLGFPAVVVCSALAVGCSLLGGATAGAAIGFGASAIGVGLLMVLLADLRVRNMELCEARAELAEAAVARERERFARDLHDLLGHSLSVIAIKAELAGRLLPDRPGDAAAEVADVERVARQALLEVRQAVSGYRRPTLEGEMQGARMALSAAGIDAEFVRAPVALDPEAEAVLAWAVREGATNVIRHSGARHCQVTVRAGLADAAVEVLDDGAGGGVNGHGAPGHGIAGLAERAERVRGRIEAGRLPQGGGFRLAVSVPTPVR